MTCTPMAFPLAFFILSDGSWSGYPAVSSEPVAVSLETGRKMSSSVELVWWFWSTGAE